MKFPSRKDDSFPYLHLSRRLCLPYAVVLAYVEYLDRPPFQWLIHMQALRPMALLEDRDKEQIEAVWKQERARQEKAAAHE